MYQLFKNIFLVCFVLIVSGFTVNNNQLLAVNILIFISSVLTAGYFLIFNRKRLKKNNYNASEKLLSYCSIFYIVYKTDGTTVLVDSRHKTVNLIEKHYDFKIYITKILETFCIKENNIQNIVANLHQNFEMDFDYDLRNIGHQNGFTKNFRIVNLIESKRIRKSFLNKEAIDSTSILIIKNNSQQSLFELCNHYKFPFIILNDKGKKLDTNQYFSNIKSKIDTNLLLKSTYDSSKSLANKDNIQNNFLYVNKKGENFSVYRITDFSWDIQTEKLGEFSKLVITQDSTKEKNQKQFWDLYCRQNSIPIAQLNDKFEIIESNDAFNNLAKFDDEKSSIFSYYIESEEKDCDFQSRLESENSIVIHVLFKLNKRNSAFAYIQKINYMNEIIVYLIDNTRQRDLEMNNIHSQKMQAIGQLAGGIAHDFNNLLTAMLGFCDLLLQKHPAGNSSFPEIIQIKQNVVRAIKLVKSLLAFSRKQTLDIKTIDVNNVILNISDLLRRLIGENIALKTFYNQYGNYIKVDQGQLEQVIINLVVNARDAISNDGEINIRTHQTSAQKGQIAILKDKQIIKVDNDKVTDGEYILIEVEDNGLGIDKAFQSKIFEPFYSTKEIGAGTGLGLSMSYGIIKQSGGHICFSSKQNQGSTFYIFFKKETVDTPNLKDDEYEDKSLPEPTFNSTEKQIIFLVEDEESVRLFATYALEGQGYQVISSDSGLNAMKILENTKPIIDLIITDVIMPGINGIQLVERIRNTKQDEKLKVLFISGYTEDKTVQDLKANNTNYDFLPKPFNLKELLNRVKKLLILK